MIIGMHGEESMSQSSCDHKNGRLPALNAQSAPVLGPRILKGSAVAAYCTPSSQPTHSSNSNHLHRIHHPTLSPLCEPTLTSSPTLIC